MDMVNMVNLTKHLINLVTKDGKTVAIAPSGTEARVAEDRTPMDTILTEDGEEIAISTVSYGAVTDLPDPQAETIYITSYMVREAVGATRPDVYSPGPLVRDEAGAIVGCEGLTGSSNAPIENQILRFLASRGITGVKNHGGDDPLIFSLKFDGSYGKGGIAFDRNEMIGQNLHFEFRTQEFSKSYPTGYEHEND